MKRIFTLIAALLATCLALSAGNIDREQALGYARQFFEGASGSSAVKALSCPALTVVWDGEPAQTKADSAPAFYVINNSEGGFVIIAGFDAAQPVLAFSAKGSFPTDVCSLPPAMKVMLDSYRDEINAARASGITQDTSAARQWSEIQALGAASSVKIPKPTPAWSQGAPYNGLCFTSGGLKAVTGCGPTSMSMVMYALGLPNGAFTGYDGYAHTYNWSGFLESYVTINYVDGSGNIVRTEKNYTEAQGNMVAELMHENGLRAGTVYGTGASSTRNQDVRSALLSYKYTNGKDVFDPAMEFVFRSSFTDAQWIFALQNEIDEGRPVIYFGVDPDKGGHAFVIDGYVPGTNKFYINWGWGQNSETSGAYALGAFNSESYRFNSNGQAVIGIKANTGGSSSGEDQLTLLYYDGISWGLNFKGLSTSAASICSGVSVTYNMGCIWNSSDTSFDGSVRLTLVDINGNVKQAAVGEIHNISLNSTGLTAFDHQGTITCDIAFGDHLVIYYKSSGSSTWRPMKIADSICRNYINVSDIAWIYLDPAMMSVGKPMSFELIAGLKEPSSVDWYYDGVRNTDGYVFLTGGSHTVKAVLTYSDGTKENITRKFRL